MYLLAATYRWNDWPKIFGLAALYWLLAAVSIAFATNGDKLLICLPVGMALAALLLLGTRYWPGVLLGATLAGPLKGYALDVSFILGTLLTLETVIGVQLLHKVGFDNRMPRARDFFFLFLLGGVVASSVTAIGAHWLLKFDTGSAVNLWFGNLLGTSLMAAIILIWREPFWPRPLGQHYRHLLLSWRAAEFLALALSARIVGQIVFLDGFVETPGTFPLEYLAFIFIVWAALRFGRHGVLVILGITFVQAMLNVKHRIGYFGMDIARGDLLNFSLYCTELLVVGMLLASVLRERNTALAIATRNESRIGRLTRLYQTLTQINQGLMRLQNESEIFPLICRSVVQFGGMKMAWIGVPAPSCHLIKPVIAHGQHLACLDDLTLRHRDHVGLRGPAAIAQRQNRVVIVNALCRKPSHPRAILASRYAFFSTLSVPLLRSGKPHAVLSMFSEQKNAFDAETISLMREMSLDIAFALDSLDRERLRQQAEQAVQHSEQRFRAFFERSVIGMAACDPHGNLLQVNDALCAMLGYRHDELTARTWHQITHPDDIDASLTLFDRSLQGESDEYEFDKRYLRHDGEIVYAHITVRCLRHGDGGINYFALLIQDVTESKKSAEIIWRQANFDQLTGLINRNLFHDRLQQEIKKSHRTRMPLALVYIDLDGFKAVNDSLGHACGDAVLVETARRIESCVRASDTLARLGGDEFVVILSQCPERGPVHQIAETIITRLDQPFVLGDDTARITASIGIAFYPDDAADMESLLSHADQAMYVSKNEGRSRLNYFTRSMREASQNRLAMVNDLRQALDGNQFRLYFQPIVELSTNRILKAEALLRWQHPESGLIEPMQFIPLAEESGMIFKIGDWVFREAARWAQRWNHSQQHGVQVSVNKSPLQFMMQGVEPAHWIAHLQELGVSGQHIAIEITESALMHAEPTVIEKLLKFRDAGIQVALDDFGTGYSALSYLNKFDIDYLKIDQSFIRNVVSDPFDKALSEAIIVMAHTLGLRVIAEGVETEAQRALLAAAGCDYAQGYLFSPPVTGPEFEAMLH